MNMNASGPICELYDAEQGGTRVVMWTYRNDDGQLVFAGQDLGTAPRAFHGSSDYEYWYTLNEQNEERLREALTEALRVQGTIDGSSITEDALVLAFKFGVLSHPSDVRRFFKAHDIEVTPV